MPALLLWLLCVVLVIVAVYLILSLIPDGRMKQIFTVVAIVIGIIILISWLGGYGGGFPPLPHYR